MEELANLLIIWLSNLKNQCNGYSGEGKVWIYYVDSVRKEVEAKGIHMVVLTTISLYYVYNIIYSIIRQTRKEKYVFVMLKC